MSQQPGEGDALVTLLFHKADQQWHNEPEFRAKASLALQLVLRRVGHTDDRDRRVARLAVCVGMLIDTLDPEALKDEAAERLREVMTRPVRIPADADMLHELGLDPKDHR